ncbi:MAG TPA: hypothetical protein VF503_25500 [Sphingobium sp.]|uniref:hypothetical protein n=1 Tax=Sphingobium sp. TaxID=1912891 RepID=UPI002ED0C60F
MSLNDLESHVLAYYLVSQADELNIAGRFFPRNAIIDSVEDKMKIATRKFGRKVGAAARPGATQFVDRLIADGGFSTKEDKFGGVMHQFQTDRYRELVVDIKAADPVVGKVPEAGDPYWETTFAELVA